RPRPSSARAPPGAGIPCLPARSTPPPAGDPPPREAASRWPPARLQKDRRASETFSVPCETLQKSRKWEGGSRKLNVNDRSTGKHSRAGGGGGQGARKGPT